MSNTKKIWLTYSALGLVLSLVVTFLLDSFPARRFISNEAVVFGIMSASMGGALKKASSGES